MPEHRIRLNRAWEIRALPPDFQPKSSGAASLMTSPIDERYDLPLLVDDQPADDDGRPVRLLLSRWFNTPSNLAFGQPLAIVVGPPALVGTLQLNGSQVLPVAGDDGGSLRFDVTGKLQRHNRLDILVADPHALAQASIALVIHDAGNNLDFDRFAADRESLL